jgi:hypothetical protein
VDHEVGEVEEDPLLAGVALDVVGAQPGLAQGLQHRVGDGEDLLLVLPGGEDEVVGEGHRLAQVQDDHLARLLAEGGPGRAPRRQGLHRYSPRLAM